MIAGYCWKNLFYDRKERQKGSASRPFEDTSMRVCVYGCERQKKCEVMWQVPHSFKNTYRPKQPIKQYKHNKNSHVKQMH